MTYEKHELAKVTLTNGEEEFGEAFLVLKKMVREEDNVYTITLWNQWNVRSDWNSTNKKRMQARALQEIGRLVLGGFRMCKDTTFLDYYHLT